METKTRKPRFGKSPHRDSGLLGLRSKTLDLLQVIYEMEYIRTSHIRPLLPDRTSLGGLSTSLTTLHAAGMVDKVLDHTSAIYKNDIYCLTDKGEAVLLSHRPNAAQYVKTYRPRGTTAPIEFPHTLMISDSMANIRAGAIPTPCRIIPQSEIEAHIGKDDDLPLTMPAQAACELKGHWHTWKGVLAPDGLFGVEYADGTKSYFAMEEQREGDVRRNILKGSSSVNRKLLAYAHTYQHKSYKTEWGIPNLRVLFRFASEEKYRAAVKLAEERFGSSPMFLFAYLPNYRTSPSGYILDPKPVPEMFTMEWARAGLEPTQLYRA